MVRRPSYMNAATNRLAAVLALSVVTEISATYNADHAGVPGSRGVICAGRPANRGAGYLQ